MSRFNIEIAIGDNTWKKIGPSYATRKCARSWVPFVKAAWHAKRARVVEIKAQKEIIA